MQVTGLLSSDPQKGWHILTILVADDSPHLRELVRITLASQGWRVVETGDATSVVGLAKTSSPDLVILDVGFDNAPAGVDGYWVCRELKGDPATSKVPVMMLSARDRASDVAAGRDAGAATYLMKPFGPIDLINAIRSVLDLK